MGAERMAWTAATRRNATPWDAWTGAVGSENQDHQFQRRIDFDVLSRPVIPADRA